MNTYSILFEGYYPVGAAAIVVAPDEETAKALLMEKIKEMGILAEQDFKVELLDTQTQSVKILLDGDY